ncbi:hypothetical protein AX774_g766 [Zancudomyces culisetae]|uniref:Uncharacterized protein n=1 Tax=Zancudomyces culisetae TaxID=1213189 RepID=A0A1R1PXP5_ZANCU|nr:hypothetical protein AX774_g766 [Zancudomyces culisetae]|eukprot:OMH85687.1 hypothetical protein AX774_g766 [Zancudomyces culisetae]
MWSVIVNQTVNMPPLPPIKRNKNSGREHTHPQNSSFPLSTSIFPRHSSSFPPAKTFRLPLFYKGSQKDKQEKKAEMEGRIEEKERAQVEKFRCEFFTIITL